METTNARRSPAGDLNSACRPGAGGWLQRGVRSAGHDNEEGDGSDDQDGEASHDSGASGGACLRSRSLPRSPAWPAGGSWRWSCRPSRSRPCPSGAAGISRLPLRTRLPRWRAGRWTRWERHASLLPSCAARLVAWRSGLQPTLRLARRDGIREFPTSSPPGTAAGPLGEAWPACGRRGRVSGFAGSWHCQG